MIHDGQTVPDGTRLTADVCIVGGGPAGLSLALRLARQPRVQVCILESGGLDFDEPTQDLARGEVIGLPYFPLHETRIRALGGSSMSWGGICTPLDELAFEERPWVPGSGWPFPAARLEPFLSDALAFCGVDEELRHRTDAASRRIAAQSGFDPKQVVITPVYSAGPARFGSVYRKELVSSKNLQVYLHSTATEIEVEALDAHVSGIRVRCLTGTGFHIAARYYVLAGGGVENARLLLVSNRTHKCGLGNAAGHVGTHFMEHPRVRTRYRIAPGNTPLGELLGTGVAGTLRFVRVSLSSLIQREEQLLNFHANLQAGYACHTTDQWEAVRRILRATLRPWKDSPYFQGAGGGRSGIRTSDLLTIFRRPDRALISAIGAALRQSSMRRFVEIYSAVEQVPDHRNRIALTSERDPLGVPRVIVRWGTAPAEEHTYRRGLEVVLGQLARLEPGISRVCIDQADPWPSELVGTWHHIGSTRMHSSPSHGVVDPDCRVHGIANLFVIGSSVFPVSASTAPTLTIIQLSLRLADHLLQALH